MRFDIDDRNTQIGLGLVLVGLLALFGNLGLFGGLGQLLGLALFVGAGALVLRAYGNDPQRVWTLPVGFGLIGLGLATLDMDWSGGAFLGALGLGFLAIYLVRREQWWAIIPGGVLLTLGLTATYDEWLRPEAETSGTVFFLGLAATFAALYLLPAVNQRWAIWPALGLAVVGVLTIGYRGGWVLPAILIGVGAWMLSRQSRPAEVPPSRDGGGPMTGGPAAGGPTSGPATGGAPAAGTPPTVDAPATVAGEEVRRDAVPREGEPVDSVPRDDVPSGHGPSDDVPPYGQAPEARRVEETVDEAMDDETMDEERRDRQD